MRTSRKVTVKAVYWLEEGHWIGRGTLDNKNTAHTQGRTLEVTQARMREAVQALLDLEPSKFEVVDAVKLPAAVRRKVNARSTEERRARVQAVRARRAAKEATEALLHVGMSLRDAGTILGVSRQRAEQILRAHDA
jgi:regulator of protease activity HflC (stomatin/prohibitin superfamily)